MKPPTVYISELVLKSATPTYIASIFQTIARNMVNEILNKMTPMFKDLPDSRSDSALSAVSVVLNVWREDWPEALLRSVESIKAQTVLPVQVVLVVDGWIPSSMQNAIRAVIACSSLNFKAIWLETQTGLWFARNAGINASTTDLVAILDCGDLMHPSRLALQSQYFVNSNLAVLGTSCIEFAEDSKQFLGVRRASGFHDQSLSSSKFLLNSPINHPSVMLRKSSISSVGGYRKIFRSEDYDLWLRLHASNLRIQNLGLPLTAISIDKHYFDRRGGLKFFRAEIELAQQKSVSLRFARPIVWSTFLVRMLYRLAPSSARRLANTLLFSSQLNEEAKLMWTEVG